MIRIVLVDDEALVRDGLRAILESESDLRVVGEAGDGAEAVRAVAGTQTDVVLMDVRMPGMDGLDACRQILAGTRPPKIIMLTTFDLDEYVYQALRSGASGFLLKDLRRAQLVAAVRAAAAGDTLVAPSVVRRLVERFCEQSTPAVSPRLTQLTDRERQVLTLVAQGMNNSDIAGTLFVSESTVKTHLMRTLAKLGLRDRVHAVVFAYENGIVRPGGPSSSLG